MSEIIFFEYQKKKYNFLKSENSPAKIVGFRPSKTFYKVLHRVPMLSLSNAFDEEDLINFEKKIGEGTFGKVYLGYIDNNKVAIKQIYLEFSMRRMSL